MIKLFSRSSNDNTLLVTEQCNNHCLMCCQPPRKQDDILFYEKRNLEIIRKSPADIDCIGITGGEPALLGKRLFVLLKAIREKYPKTLIHILTNGRAMDADFVSRFEEFDMSNIVFAIPLHSDYCGDHDRITCVKGSYIDTMNGLYVLANSKARVELRVIINAINYKRLYQIAHFIYLNLPFVEDVVFVGMEAVGDAVKNRKLIWIDPLKYQEELENAVLFLDGWGVEIGISNIPLCLLSPCLHRFSWQSISDWKVSYLPCCKECVLSNSCGGVFSTAVWQSANIHPLHK